MLFTTKVTIYGWYISCLITQIVRLKWKRKAITHVVR